MGKLFYGSFFFVVNDINGFWNKRQYHSAVHIAHLLREAHPWPTLLCDLQREIKQTCWHSPIYIIVCQDTVYNSLSTFLILM